MKIPKCRKCSIAAKRKNIVVGRGVYPADILFIAEAPGKSEDLTGEAFLGPNGKLLDMILAHACKISHVSRTPSYFVTFSVLCRPYILEDGTNGYFDSRDPSAEEVLNCTKNVMEIYRTVHPQKVIFIGKLPEKYYAKEFPGSLRILHPSFLIKNGGVQSPHYLTVVRQIADLLKDMEL